MNQSASVTHIKPKTYNKSYKNHPYKVTYDPQSKVWRWEVIYTRTTVYGETAPTFSAAFKAAEKHIDRQLKLEGKG